MAHRRPEHPLAGGRDDSSPVQSRCSWSRSPARSPTKSMAISAETARASRRARSRTSTGGPTSSQKMAFESAECASDDGSPAASRGCHQVAASSRMRHRHRAAALRPAAGRGQNASRRVDDVPEPDRCVAAVRAGSRPAVATINSATDFVCPRMLVGCTALSVEKSTKRSTPTYCAASTTRFVPSTLVATPSTGCASTKGSCLYAAAWNTTRGRYRLNSSIARGALRISARTGTALVKPWSSRSAVVEPTRWSLRLVDEDECVDAKPGQTAQSAAPSDPPAPVTRTGSSAR